MIQSARSRARFALWFCMVWGAVSMGLCAAMPAAAQGMSIERIKTVPPEITEKGMTAEDGKVAFKMRFGEFEFIWSEIPKVIPPEGFMLKLSIHGRLDSNVSNGGTLTVATSILGSGFTTSPDISSASIDINPGQELRNSVEIKVVPNPGLKEGDTVVLQVGPSLGGTYTYTYRAGGGAPDEGPQLTATLEGCPDRMVISELPGRSCHLMIGGFRHNTADPVQVILPSAMDGTGNHGNGLQLLNTSGVHDVYEMSDPYPWLVSLFVCPGQKGAGVNCNGTAANPGPLSVPIVVRQKGSRDAMVTLTVTAVVGPNSTKGIGSAAGGAAVTSTSVAAGPGQLGASIECPGTIYISMLPDLDCNIMISGWTRGSPAPVIVSLPSKTDDYGNHTNGIQLIAEGEEDVFSWDGDSHPWGMIVFACPGQDETAANCYESKTSPGLQVVPIHIEQEGLAAADIMLMIDAQPHP